MIINSSNQLFRFSEREDLIFIISEKLNYSYKQFFTEAKQLAAFLYSKRISENSYLPILIDDQFLFIKTVLAAWYLKAVPVPINSKMLEVEINSLLKENDFKLILTDRHKLKIDNESLNVIQIKSAVSEEETVIEFDTPSIENNAVIIFTSGSSGKPKGIIHTFSSLINSIENGLAILNQNINSRWLASLPFYHIGGFQILCRTFYSGCSLILPGNLKNQNLFGTITNLEPTHISLVAAQLQQLLAANVNPPKNLVLSLIGGGFTEDELIIEADQKGWKPKRVYGSSETASFVTSVSPDEIRSKPNSVGKSVPNVAIEIENGEVLVKSKSLFSGFLNETKSKNCLTKDGFYPTGDIGRLDNDGFLFIEAKRQDLIVTGGENVNPYEVENALIEIDEVLEACVFPLQNKKWGQIVCAAIVCSKKISEEDILENLKARLAGFKVPKQIYFTDSLPKTALGKLEREKIQSLFI